MAKPKDDKLNISIKLDTEDKVTHYLIRKLMNFQTDTQVIYYMYGQYRKYLGENPEYIIDLKQAKEALSSISELNKRINELTREIAQLKKQ